MNRLFIVSGNSGGGKTSIMRSVMGVGREIVSVTTRAPRKGEVDGIDYFFITKEEFNRLKDTNQLVEFVEYSGCSYGVTVEEFNTKLAAGDAYVICEYRGFLQFSKLYPKTTSIYIYNKRGEAEFAMYLRGDSPESIYKRMKTYSISVARGRGDYDYVVYNCFGGGYRAGTEKVIHAILTMWGTND